MTTWGDVTQWRGDAVGAAGDQLRADVRRLERAADEVRARVVPGSWLGLATVFARARQRRLVVTMDTHVAGARAFATAIFAAEGKVSGIHEVVVELVHDARAQEFEIGSDGSVTDVAGSRTFDSAHAADAYTQGRIVERDALVARIQSVLDKAYEVDSALVQARPDDAFNDAGPHGVVDPEVERDWSTMSDAERRAVLEHMARELADRYGVDDFDVIIEDLEDRDGKGGDDDPSLDYHGYWSEDDKGLHLDSNELADPDLINTMAHEVRHAAQHEMIRDANPGLVDQALIDAGIKDDPFHPPPGVTADDVQDWKDNFDDYHSPEDDFDAYHDQPVEADARDSGEQYLEDLDPDDLDREREGAR